MTFERDFKVYLTLFRYSDPTFRQQLEAVVSAAGNDCWGELHEDVATFLFEHRLDEAWLASITELGWPPGEAVLAAVPGWSGEQTPFPVRDFAGLTALTNLTSFQWPDTWEVPVEAIPEHPRLRRVTFPTSYYGRSGLTRNDAARDALLARGFVVESAEDHGTTTMVRT